VKTARYILGIVVKTWLVVLSLVSFVGTALGIYGALSPDTSVRELVIQFPSQVLDGLPEFLQEATAAARKYNQGP
jgi:hypothetical protein